MPDGGGSKTTLTVGLGIWNPLASSVLQLSCFNQVIKRPQEKEEDTPHPEPGTEMEAKSSGWQPVVWVPITKPQTGPSSWPAGLAVVSHKPLAS